MSLFRRYLGAAGYIFTSAIVARGALFIAAALIARFLSRSDYGLYSLVVSFLVAVAPFACIRLDVGMIKFLPEAVVREPTQVRRLTKMAWSHVLAIVVPVALLVWAFSGTIANDLYHESGASRLLALTAPLIVVLCIYQVSSGMLEGLQNFRALAFVRVIVALFQAVATVTGAFVGGIAGAVGGYAFSAILGALVIYLATRGSLARVRPVEPSPVRWSPQRLELLCFSSLFLFATVSWAVLPWVGNAVLVRFRGLAGAADFTVAFSFVALTLFLPGNLANPAMPFLVEAHASDRRTEFRVLLERSVRMVLFMGLPMALFLGTASREIIQLIYGQRFENVWLAALMVSFGAVFAGCIGILGQALVSSGRVLQAAGLNWIWVASFVGLAWWLTPRWGVPGAGVAYLLSTILTCTAYLLLVRRAYGATEFGLKTATLILVPGSAISLLLAFTGKATTALPFGLALWFVSAAILWRALFTQSERGSAMNLLRSLSNRLTARVAETF